MSQEFPRGLMKLVIAQICQSYNFTSIENSACDALIDLLQRYIEEIGYYSNTYAQHAGRVDCNVNDILLGLSELNVSYEDLKQHFSHSQEILLPFERTIPKFPMAQKTKKPKTLEASNYRPPPHILPHFSPFPEKHTYLNTDLLSVRETEPKEVQKTKLKERNQVQSGLLRIQELRDTDRINDTDAYDFELIPDEDFEKFQASFKEDFPNSDTEDIFKTGNIEKYVKELLEPVDIAETPKKDDKVDKLDEKSKKRIDYILSLSHEGNTLEEVPAHLLNNPVTTTASSSTTTTTTLAPTISAPITYNSTISNNKMASNIPTVMPTFNNAYMFGQNKTVYSNTGLTMSSASYNSNVGQVMLPQNTQAFPVLSQLLQQQQRSLIPQNNNNNNSRFF